MYNMWGDQNIKCPSCDKDLLRKTEVGKTQGDVTGFLYFTCDNLKCSLNGKQLDISLKVKEITKC